MQKQTIRFFLISLLILFIINIGSTFSDDNNAKPNASKTEEMSDESEAAFNTMMEVIAHKRCVNCHPASDRPNQGEDSHPHYFGVRRGEDGHGTPTVRCNTCHQKENNDYSGVPGAPDWALAPESMAWEGLNKYQIARAMVDPAKNGGRNIHQIEEHLTEHELVLWAFEPGVNHEGIPREKPPVSEDDYITAVKKWVELGAVIPEGE